VATVPGRRSLDDPNFRDRLHELLEHDDPAYSDGSRFVRMIVGVIIIDRHDEGGFDCRRKISLPNLYSEIPFTGFRGKTARIAFPDDPRMFQHIHPVGMRKCESNVLLAEQHRNRRCLA
jgi:hypothetical protein